MKPYRLVTKATFIFRFSTIYSLLLFFCPLQSQQEHITGSLYSAQDSLPIDYAAVYVAGKKIGTYTDENGMFMLSFPPGSLNNDTIVFSQIGYKNRLLPAGNLRLPVIQYLQIDTFLIEEISIIEQKTARLTKKKLGGWKKKARSSISSDAIKGNASFAQFVQNPFAQTGFIKEVAIYFSTVQQKKEPFGLNIYSFDPNCSCPGKSLLKEQVIIKKSKSGWNRVRLKDQIVELPGRGFFVTFEKLKISSGNHSDKSHALGFIKKGQISEPPPFIKLGGSSWAQAPVFGFGSSNSRLILVRATVEIYEEE